jgi:RNA polymerase subunit RPABC4/transcription elongation factor Spt4
MPACPNCTFTINKDAKVCPWCDNPVDAMYAPTKDTSGAIVAGSSQVSALMKRYRDAYLVAKVTDGFGGMIKGIGIAIAVLLALVGFMLMGNSRARDATFALGVMTLMSGVVAGVWIYIAGVLVSTQGQILKASLDGAVNSSPFLANEHKAKIMSLPEA